MPDIPVSLQWEEINKLWQQIYNAKATKDPAQWEEVVGGVRKALDDWLVTINYWPNIVKKYNILKAAADRATGEKKQELQDIMQSLRERMPGNVRKALDEKKKLVPLRARSIEELKHNLEGIRQGDFDAYPPQIKTNFRLWENEQFEERSKKLSRLKSLKERLDGIKDPDRLKSFTRRLNDITRDYERLAGELDKAEDAGDEMRAKSLAERIASLIKEAKGIARRVKGATKPEARAKLIGMIHEEELALKSPEDIKRELFDKAREAKYDALLWMVTNIAHPIKVLKTKEPIQKKPTKMPYMPPKPEETLPGVEELELEEPGPNEASEYHIFISLINEEKYELAREFINDPFTLSDGDLIILQHHDLDGLKGRIRQINNGVVTVDLFKNDVADKSSLQVALHQAHPYTIEA